MAKRLYDEEFSSGILQMLKDRDVLGRSNRTHFHILFVNLDMYVERMEQEFDKERRENPVLETTPPEAWLTASIMRTIEDIRPRVMIQEIILEMALKRYFKRSVPVTRIKPSDDQQLITTIEPYREPLRKLMGDLFDRKQSVRGILGIPRTACTLREAMSERKPISQREEIILRGIKENWSNQTIAAELDEAKVKPRARDFKSYGEIYHLSAQNFYSLKSEVKRKYLK